MTGGKQDHAAAAVEFVMANGMYRWRCGCEFLLNALHAARSWHALLLIEAQPGQVDVRALAHIIETQAIESAAELSLR